MNHQIHDSSHESPAARKTIRTLLWSILVISAAGNSLASVGGAGVLIHVALGIVTAVCAAGLIADWKRSRA